jgi:putative ABC transport system permease protein
MTLFDLLLALYPRRVRERFGDGMRAAFAADYADARGRGRRAAVAFVLSTVVQTFGAAAAERLPRPAAVRSFFTTDVRDAIRSLAGTPLVTGVAVLSLTLGIGANTALYSILYSLVSKPLPVAAPERLALLAGNDWTNPIWEEIRRRPDLFDGAFAWSRERFNLSTSGPVDPVDGGYVSGSAFDALGITPALGRLLTERDDVRGGGAHGHAAVIGHGWWQRRFGGRADVLGRPLRINGMPFTIVGVAPAGFVGPEVGERMDLFLPLASEGAIRGPESTLDGRSSWWLQIMVRLRPDQDLESGAAALNAVRPAIRQATMPLDAGEERRAHYLAEAFTLAPAATGGVSPLRTRFAGPLTVIMAVVAAVLLIACANIASLMLARAATRRHEMSVRLALGASRARLGAQLFVESLLLGIAGAAAGLVLARAGATLLIAQFGAGAASLDVSIDVQVLGFTTLIALTATLLFGMAPALALRGVQPNEVLKEGSRAVAGDGRGTLRSVLVVAQIALSFALVAGAGLFGRTFSTLAATPLGFDPERLLIINVDARQSPVEIGGRPAFYQRVAEAVGGVPGVARASVSFLTPLSGRGWNNRVEVAGGPVLAARERVTWLNAVGPRWFETYGMRLIAGRDFSASDSEGATPVAVVNEAFVRRFVGSANPIGLPVKALGSPMPDATIIGVVNDTLYRSPRSGVAPIMYVPMAQAGPLASGFAVAVRLAAERGPIDAQIAEAVTRVDPALTVAFRDYSDQVRATVAQERLVAILSACFAGLAMLLAALGLYGVTAYAISRRLPELAVRVALGASARRVVRLVLGKVLVLLVAGNAIGVVLVLWGGRFARTLLFGVEPHDPVMIAGAAAILIGVGVVAGWLPARRAALLNPTQFGVR